MDSATIWNIIDTYFQDNPQALVQTSYDSYNDFYKNGIYRIFKETKPSYPIFTIRSRLRMNICLNVNFTWVEKMVSKIYFGKPVFMTKSMFIICFQMKHVCEI